MADKVINRRQFLKGSFKYGAAAGVGTYVATKPGEANAFFISAAKIYGELVGLACRPPTIMSYEFASEMISEFFGTANSGSVSTYLTGAEKIIEAKAEVDRNDIAREAELSPKMCDFQSIGFTQQRYMYRDAQVVNTFCLNPPTLTFPMSPQKLDTKLLASYNGRTRNLTADERSHLMHQFRSMGHDQTERFSYTDIVYSDHFKASQEVRRILSFQALNTEAASLGGDERYSAQEQMHQSFNSQEWRDELTNKGGATGLMAEATRLLGQSLFNEHQLFLKEEKLLTIEALIALDKYAKMKRVG